MSVPPPSQKQARVLWVALTSLALALLAALLAGLIWALGKAIGSLSPVLWPLAMAAVIAYLLDPLVDYIERKGAARAHAIACVFGLALALLALLAGTVLPPLIYEGKEFTARIPAYLDRANDYFQKWAIQPHPFLETLFLRGAHAAQQTATTPPANEQGQAISNSPSATGVAETNNTVAPQAASASPHKELAGQMLRLFEPKNVGAWIQDRLGRIASGFIALGGMVLVPVYAFYFLLEKRAIAARWTDYLPVPESGFKRELVFLLDSLNHNFIAFFRGQVLVALCNGTLYGIGFLIIGLEYSVLLGAAAVLLTLVPYLGAIVTSIIAIIVALAQFGDWQHPLLVLAVFVVVQSLEALVISPRVMRGRVGLHPATIIIAVMVGTTLLGGLLGGILAIPLTAALRVVLSRYVWKRPVEDA